MNNKWKINVNTEGIKSLLDPVYGARLVGMESDNRRLKLVLERDDEARGFIVVEASTFFEFRNGNLTVMPVLTMWVEDFKK